MSNFKVIGIGALNIDQIDRVKLILGDRETVLEGPVLFPGEYSEADVERLGLFPGGSAANTIYGLAKLGLSTGFIGVVGDDTEGENLLHDFQKVGVDTSQVKIKHGAKTGLARCLSDELNFRSIHIVPGANDLLTVDDVDLAYINQAEMLHISSFTGDQQFKLLLKLMAKLGFSAEVSFSPGALYASKGLPALTPILRRTHVLFINESEMRQLTGEDFNAGAKRCLDLGCRIVVVTLGQGASYKTVMATSYIRTVEREYVVKPADKSIISASDTIGAGDAFAAGFLYGLLKEKNLDECGLLGDVVARFSITKTGARQGLPTLPELAQRYHQLYNKPL